MPEFTKEEWKRIQNAVYQQTLNIENDITDIANEVIDTTDLGDDYDVEEEKAQRIRDCLDCYRTYDRLLMKIVTALGDDADKNFID